MLDPEFGCNVWKLMEDEFSDRARRPAAYEQRQRQYQERQVVNDTQRLSQQVDARLQSADRQAEMKRRQKQAARLRQSRQEQMERRQVDREAQIRLQTEKRQLRELCMRRYNRPDCQPSR